MRGTLSEAMRGEAAQACAWSRHGAAGQAGECAQELRSALSDAEFKLAERQADADEAQLGAPAGDAAKQ